MRDWDGLYRLLCTRVGGFLLGSGRLGVYARIECGVVRLGWVRFWMGLGLGWGELMYSTK